MELIRNLDDANMGEVYWRLYRRYISLFIENEADDAYAWRCARALDELDDAVIERLCAASLRYRAARLERWASLRRKSRRRARCWNGSSRAS